MRRNFLYGICGSSDISAADQAPQTVAVCGGYVVWSRRSDTGICGLSAIWGWRDPVVWTDRFFWRGVGGQESISNVSFALQKTPKCCIV